MNDDFSEVFALFESGSVAVDNSFIGMSEVFDKLDGESDDFAVPPFRQKTVKSPRRRMVAIDLETDRIPSVEQMETLPDGWTPTPRYVTAFGDDGDFQVAERIDGNGIEAELQLLTILESRILTRDNHRTRFVSWNGNRYDTGIICRALLHSGLYQIQPYLTGSKSLRGCKVFGQGKLAGCNWEFLDGMAMTGLDTVGMPLKKFLKLFAPEYTKLDLDFSTEDFNADLKAHRDYAMRDSEGLWYGMVEVERIIRDLTGNGLQPTMGNCAIKFLQSRLPPDAVCFRPSRDLQVALLEGAKRGGYCWINRQYTGKVWKYDLNQAYAAAMRDAKLPGGRLVRSEGECIAGLPGVYKCRLFRKSLSPVPFYIRDAETGAGRFTTGNSCEAWLLSIEIDHLRADDWEVEVFEGWYWEETFNLEAMVNELEKLRFTDPQGPSGPLGLMVKTLGNSAYGKTLEQLWGQKLVMARDCPDGYYPFMPDLEGLSHVYAKDEPVRYRPYHCPQLGCFITAHVRLLVRDAALGCADGFLYADTDCVVFDRPVDFLEIDPRRYGAWKEESAGKDYILIAKKVYWGEDGAKHAKGLHVKNLTKEQFELWREGEPPCQKQVQRRNFVKLMAGQAMFGLLERNGTDVRKSKQTKLVEGRFLPL